MKTGHLVDHGGLWRLGYNDAVAGSLISDPVSELLAALSAELARLGSRWYLFGAQAVILWGRPRLTADVDVTIELELDAVPSLLAGLEGRGFELRVRLDADAIRATLRLLEEALGQSDLLPVFEAEWHRASDPPG